MDVREIVLNELQLVVEKFASLPFPTEVSDEMYLEDFWLDSVAFVSLLAGLENKLGIIPMKMLQGVWFPETIGELVTAYSSELAEVETSL